ncbi:MAG: ATP-binding protein [Ignavibacteriales bacterium]|nr:ATP-binding protein [Ignavibacteriales bacterium]
MPLPNVGISVRLVSRGLFISAGVVVLLIAAQLAWRSHIEADWARVKIQKQQDLASAIQSKVDLRVEAQRLKGGMIRSDEAINLALLTMSPGNLASAFQRLAWYNADEDISIDVVDSAGNIILWSGRRVLSSFASTLRNGSGEDLTFVSQARLHRFLSVGVATSDKSHFVFVSRPLETTYPVSNRFVSSASLADELAKETGLPIRFVSEVAHRDTAGEAAFAIPLKDGKNNLFGFAIAPPPSIPAEIQKADRFPEAGKSLFAAAGMCFLALLMFLMVQKKWGNSTLSIVLVVLVWSVRIGWKLEAFPGLLVGGFLFDPAVHSSPFPLGLAGSLGELVLSAAALLFTVLMFLKITYNWWSSPGQPSRRASLHWRYLLAILLPFVSQWLVRAYGAAMRSFVFDSSIRYRDPLSLLPNAPMMVMHLNILLLTLALGAACLAVVFVAHRMLGGAVREGRIVWIRVTTLAFTFLASYCAYLYLDQPPLLPVYLPPVLYASALGLVLLLEFRGISWQPWRARPLVATAVVLAGAFMFTVVGLDSKTHEKERERAQLEAEGLLRPVDNWLSLVVSESLRGATGRAANQLTAEGIDSTVSVDLAFGLWAQTLMSKEGYNSALVVYDPSGKELSRFSVGLTSFDQMELLTQLFHKEEEALLVVDRKVSDGNVKYYGEWGYVLGAGNQPIGSIAIVMSASQRTLFRGEAPEQLRSTSREPLEDAFRKVSITEYRDGIIWSTNDPILFKGMRLDPSIGNEVSASAGRFIWSTQDFEGASFDVLYAKDDAVRSRVLLLRIGSLDVRWHLFNIVKTLLVYLLFLGFVGIAVALPSLARGRSPRFGFREKLITSFAVLSVVPLLLMAYYNRELAIERLDQNIAKRLSEDLEVTQQRISTAVEDDQDFAQGVTNDFCEAVASDLGVDFSVYHGAELKASSRPELYRASILDNRLTGTAFVNTVVMGRGFYETRERIGEVSYIVGYRPIFVGDSIRGVLAVPALYRQQEIDEELAQRNAFVLGAYALVVSFVVGLALVLANALSRPLRDLSSAARSVGKGDLDVVLRERSNDEVGDLIHSFNEMTTELKANRVNLARAERELAWKEMAKQVAHEIKNPLTPIKLSVQHLVQAYRQEAKDFGDILQRVSQTVIEQIDVLTRIASEFSNFARMPERKFERVDLSQLVNETIDLFSEVQGVEFRHAPSDAPAVVVADKDELRRVFINVVRNSVQAMEGKGIIVIDMNVAHQICSIRITDTGSGIPEEIQSSVFQPNFSTKTDGMGLGLAIARKVIEDLNGTIRLQSKVGHGTTVEMNIPLRHG